ncbi:MAG TPA: methyltransferase domain-containing protein [Opitutaceae bacterium]|jgi:SAM-dependent methyltransferase
MTTTPEPIRFNDGAAYERYMGVWSQCVGDSFLRWLAPQPGLRWLDVGCGNGAFTEMLIEKCSPASVHGIDPADGQLAFARTRASLKAAQLLKGDAMALPFPADHFDAAVMPLVIFFVPEPARGVAEMARVVGAGGIVAAYTWDMLGGGFPYATLQAEMKALGVIPLAPPRPEASALSAMRELWIGAGLDSVATQEIAVERTFANLEDYWATVLGGPSTGAKLAALPPEMVEALKSRLRTVLPADASGRITCRARANAVSGRVRAG